LINSDVKFCSHCGSRIPVNAKYCPICGLSQETVTQPVRKEILIGQPIGNMLRLRLILFTISLAVFVIGFLIGSLTNLSHSDAELIKEGFLNNIGENPTAFDIAVNNITLCMMFFIPVFGSFFMAFVSYNTGIVLSAIALLSQSTTTQLELFFATLIFPWTWFELLAYALASSQGILLLIGILKGRFKQEVKQTLKTIAICIILLVIGAIIEGIAIKAI
jgi:uncharacterized membrane protein SpoIIM required for sporulation